MVTVVCVACIYAERVRGCDGDGNACVVEIKSYGPQLRSKLMFESLKREITETTLPHHWKDTLHISSWDRCSY